jgi:hypothetical protein
MTYAQMHDGFFRNPKVKRAGNMAGWMWVASIGYANENLTDGFIPVEALNELSELDSKPRLKLAAKLVEVGLWEVTKGGWNIHDFLMWNFTREQVLTKRAANLARVNKHRSGAASNGDGNARVMRYKDGDSGGDQRRESAPSSDPLILCPSETGLPLTPSPTEPVEQAAAPKHEVVVVKPLPPDPVAPTIDPKSTDPTDLLNALAASANGAFDRWSGIGTDVEVQFLRRLADYGFTVQRIRLLGAAVAKRKATWPTSKLADDRKVAMAWLMGTPSENGKRGGSWLGAAVAIVEAQEAAEAKRRETPRVTQPPPVETATRADLEAARREAARLASGALHG